MKRENSIEAVTCSIEMRIDADKTDRAVELLLSVVEPIEAKMGCHECSISRDAVERDRIRYSEVWASEAEFQTHVRSVEFRSVLVAMDLCCEEPKVTIGAHVGRTGIEYLQDIRGGLRPVLDPDD